VSDIDWDQTVKELLKLDQRLLEQLGAVLALLPADKPVINKQSVDEVLVGIDTGLNEAVNRVLYDPRFRELEGVWRSISDLESATDFGKNIVLSLLDVSKDELNDDISANIADWTNSELFSLLYAKEYDQHGGSPYGALIGLYNFDQSDEDLGLLKGMASVCKKSHVPFVGSASAAAFNKSHFEEVTQLREVDGELTRNWHMFRKQEESAYVGLTLPRYVARAPYKNYPLKDLGMRLTERNSWQEPIDAALTPEEQLAEARLRMDADYVWGSSAMLFAQNLVKSFRDSGWCQYIRGVDSGGTVRDLPLLPRDPITDEVAPPVEVVIPDNLEFSLAKAGFIPLVWEKGTGRATFFSAQSMKATRDGSLALTDEDAHYAENEQLTTNLSYTYTICRLAHYLKMMMRGNIGSTADANYVKSQIDAWISRYVTTVINPDDLTLRYYPFKAYNSAVDKVAGRVGWFDCTLTVQPHLQFEGVDITLKVDARLAD
jgi:type VI secretion system protein ImpC